MRPLIGTNWKMNMTPAQADEWLRAFLPLVAALNDRDLFVMPPYTAIFAARDRLSGSRVAWGAQDVHPADAGAHTGDISAPMLADLGCTYVAVGHAERRRDHGDTPELISTKAAAALRWGMRPVICIGQKSRMPADETLAFLLDDLGRCVSKLEPVDLHRAVIAYEPQWAMGEGSVPAEPAEVSEVHLALADWLNERSAGAPPPIIYGGSVDVALAPDMLAAPGVDGLFVGRYALDPVRFGTIAATPAPAVRGAT